MSVLTANRLKDYGIWYTDIHKSRFPCPKKKKHLDCWILHGLERRLQASETTRVAEKIFSMQYKLPRESAAKTSGFKFQMDI